MSSSRPRFERSVVGRQGRLEWKEEAGASVGLESWEDAKKFDENSYQIVG